MTVYGYVVLICFLMLESPAAPTGWKWVVGCGIFIFLVSVDTWRELKSRR